MQLNMIALLSHSQFSQVRLRSARLLCKRMIFATTANPCPRRFDGSHTAQNNICCVGAGGPRKASAPVHLSLNAFNEMIIPSPNEALLRQCRWKQQASAWAQLNIDAFAELQIHPNTRNSEHN